MAAQANCGGVEPLVCCLGDLVEDIAVRLREPLRLGTDTAARIERHRGGSAANVAAMVAGSGGRARFAGRVGDDALGERLIEMLAAFGVDVAVQRAGRTGSIVVLVAADGERSFLTDRAAAAELAGVDTDALLDGVGWLHVPWYSLRDGPIAEEARRAVTAATSRAIPVSIDASSVALLDGAGAAALRRFTLEAHPAVVLCNEQEAAALAVGPDGLAGAAVTVVKQGADPAVILRRGRAPVEVPVPPGAAVVDTTGAGDAFAAGWIRATLAGAGPVAAARAGHRLARRVIGRPGADTWAPDTEHAPERDPGGGRLPSGGARAGGTAAEDAP
jgi:sugar/nucleoside kinase (ribokinase family)